jgi:hypothetical protein
MSHTLESTTVEDTLSGSSELQCKNDAVYTPACSIKSPRVLVTILSTSKLGEP